MGIAGHLIGLDTAIHGVLGIKRIMADDRRFHVFFFPSDNERLAQPLLLGPMEHVDIGGIADDDRDLFSAVLLQPARQMLFEDGKLVAAHAIALERHEGALQAGVQAKTIDQAHRDKFVLGVARGVASVFEVVAIHRPDRATSELGKRPEPVARLQEPVEHFVGTGGHFRDHGGAPSGMERVEPSGAGQRFAPILTGLEEVPAGIALAEHALETTPQELFVTELRGVPPVAAVVAQ